MISEQLPPAPAHFHFEAREGTRRNAADEGLSSLGKPALGCGRWVRAMSRAVRDRTSAASLGLPSVAPSGADKDDSPSILLRVVSLSNHGLMARPPRSFRGTFVWGLAALFLLALVFAADEASGASLSELVSKAKQEGALNVTVTSSMSGRATPKLAAAFAKRFGLSLSVTLTPATDTENYPRAIAETKAGTVPTYDAIEGSEVNNISLMGAAGLHRVENWESLLAEIHPLVRDGKVRSEQISSPPLSGYAFEYVSRVKAILYNPRLISSGELPKTHLELAHPKYKGKWTQPPWTSHWDIGPFVYSDVPREKWLEIVRNAGQNAGAVQTEQRGLERVLLGEFAFAIANTYYAFSARAKDPKAPIQITYFKDYNQANGAYYVVRKGARHPAAATLFALWMVTPEAESIWQTDIFATQYKWGESELDRSVRELIRKTGANIVELVSTKEGRDFLAWYGTEEGRKFRQTLGKAIRGE